MAAFTIAYRLPSGGLKTEVVDAADRAAVLAQLKERGITPVSVKAGGKLASVSSSAAKPAWIKGAIAGVVVVVVAIVALVCLMSKEKPEAKPPEPIKKVQKPEKVKIDRPRPMPVQEKKVEAPQPMVTNRHGRVVAKKSAETYVDGAGVLRYKLGNGRVPPEHPERFLVQAAVHSSGLPDFKYNVENELATLLTTEPGDMLFGDFTYDEQYRQDFVKSLLEPVQINEDDTDSDKAVKEMVEAAKRELADRIKKGEDIGEIMQSSRDEIRRLASYKQQMQDLFHEAVQSGELKSTADVDDYFAAMNKMLESKGIEPIKMTGLVRRKLRYDIRKQQEQQQAGSAKKE